MAKLEIRNLTVIYENKKQMIKALDDFSLNVEAGDFLVIVGPSGCGKTTLLKTIAGLVFYDEGEIFLNGIPAETLSIRERNLAYVSQSYSLYPHLTIFENIAIPLKAAKVPLEELIRRVEEVAKQLQIDFLLTRKPRHLSGGQQQRVALARSLVKRPDIYLFDEPFSNLEAALRRQFRFDLLRLQQLLKGTFIFSTHDLQEAMALASTLAVMTPDGKLAQIGKPLDVYQHPVNEYVRNFFLIQTEEGMKND